MYMIPYMIRKPNMRLRGHDYGSTGKYFVTIRAKFNDFGTISNGMMHLNETGLITYKQWNWLETNFNYIKLDSFCIMPDHIHGILEILESDSTNKNLSKVICAFKTTSSKKIHLHGYADFKWQRSFYDRIIKNYEMLNAIQKYIRNNAFLHENKNTYVRNRKKISSFR